MIRYINNKIIGGSEMNIKVKYMDYEGNPHNKNFKDTESYDKWRFRRNFRKILTKTIDGQCLVINN